jgi:hypothetical protein
MLVRNLRVQTRESAPNTYGIQIAVFTTRIPPPHVLKFFSEVVIILLHLITRRVLPKSIYQPGSEERKQWWFDANNVSCVNPVQFDAVGACKGDNTGLSLQQDSP